MNNIKKYGLGFILFMIILFFIVSGLRAEDRTKQEKKIVSQIESSYNQGKKSLADEDFLTAIVEFNRVIELEKGFYTVYTPYAEKYIQQAQEEIRQKEEKVPEVDVEKKQEEKEALTGSKPQESVDKEDTAKVIEYTISAEDVLYISVWQEEDLNQEVIVRPDGKISFPLAGDVPALGATFAQLKEEITQRLKDYIKYPVVSISLRKLGGKKIVVLGEVGSPGVYSVTGRKTVLEAVALAGGFTPDAILSSVIYIQGGLQTPQGKRLNLSRALKKADLSQNVTLQPEDIIYVPKKFIANVNYTMSQILGPIYQGTVAGKAINDW
ncbi:MAG: polysaccharide biosynthesis/export family protein [bacterium]